MRIFPLRRLWPLALAGALALASCQSSSSDTDTPAPTGERTSVVVVYKISKTEPWKTPDSLAWSAPGQSGSGQRPRASDSVGNLRSYLVSLTLKTPLRDSTLNLRMYRFGVRLLQVDYRAMGAKDTLTAVSGSVRYDSVALALLRGMDSLKATQPQTREGLLNLYGTWILAGDARVKGFPAILPVGIAAPEVIQATLVAAAKIGKPLVEQAKTWSLGVSTDSAQSLILELLRSGKIVPKDSSSLFPPPPVRVSAPLAVGAGLRAGGTSAGITGSFAWDQGLGLVVLQGEVTRDGKPDTNLVVYGLPVPKSTDREAKLEGAASLLAKASAPEGTYVLSVTAQDGAQHTAVSRDTFTVAAKLPDQPQAPRIRLLSPSDKSIVPFETSEVATTWIASTPQGTVSTVTVDGATAEKGNDSTWQAKVRLEPTGKARTIVARATNSAGLEAVATLELTRQADQTGPSVTWIAPTSDLEVENGVTSLTVRIKATDPSGIDTVLISGSKPDSLSASGEYVRKVPLTVVGSPQAIVVRVVDSAKNPTTSSKSVTRANPPTDVAPKTVLLEPSSKTGTIVPFETKSVTVRWAITDPYGIDSSSVTVNGKPAKAEAENKWSAVVDLVADTPTAILMSVKNRNGVSGGDVASVTRQADTTRPKLTWVAGGRSVGYDSAEVAVGVKASDNDSLASVTISGLVASENDGVFTVRLKPDVGDNPVQVVALDRTGNKDTLLAVLHRYQKLSITRIAPTGPDTTVGSGIGSVALSWKVSGAKTVGVGDSVLTAAGGLYTWTANTSGSAAKVVLWAADSAGKRDTSAVMVNRQSVAALTLSYGADTLSTLPDSVVIKAVSETGATLAWSLDGKAWTPFTGSFVQKVSGAAQVRAQVTGKDDSIATWKVHTLYHLNHAPTIALTSTGLLVKSYLGSFAASVVKVTDWGAGDDLQTATYKVQMFDLADTQFVTGLSVNAQGQLSGTVRIDTSVTVKLRIQAKDNGGTAKGGVDTSSWSTWLPIQIADTVKDPQNNVYRALRMPDGKVWMRSNLRATPKTVPPPDIDTFPCFRNDCVSYGVLYTDVQAFTFGATYDPTLRNAPARGICPAGWHMASRKEWNRLFVATMDPGASDSLRNLMSDTAWTVYVAKPSPRRESIGGANKYKSFLLPSLNSDPLHDLGADISYYWMPSESGVDYGASLLASTGFNYYRASVRCLIDTN